MKILLSTLAAACMSAAVAAWTTPSPAFDYVVRIDKNFNPDRIEVKVGDTVIWKNFDSESHTVSAEFRPGQPQDLGGFDSGVILSGGSFQYSFSKPGTYKYYCKLRREMLGTVVVTR